MTEKRRVRLSIYLQALSKPTAEIDQLQSRLGKAPVDKAAKKEIQKEISAKKNEKKKLEKNGVDHGLGNIGRADANVYFTWKALQAREDENSRIDASPLALRGLLSANQKALPDAPVRPPFDEARIDDWAMTSLKQSEYPRPLVQYWLRGVIDDESAQTTLVWRIELDHIDFAGIPENKIDKQAIELADDGNPTEKPKDSHPVLDVVGDEWTRYLIIRHPSEKFSIKQITKHGQLNDMMGEIDPFRTWRTAIKSELVKGKGVRINAKEIQKAFADVDDEEKKAVNYIAFFFNQDAGKPEKKSSLEADHYHFVARVG